MKNIKLMAAMAAVIGGAVMASAGAHAQTAPLEAWQPPQQGEMDPAKRVPATKPASTVDDASQAAAASPQSYSAASAEPTHSDHRGGFFLGVQGGKGWVYDDVDQSTRAVNAGYRWQAGAVTLVGIEVAAGRLEDTEEGAYRYSEVEYASIGANARFNFGDTSPVYGLVRAGYWAAENELGDSADGAYVGLGLGVDFTRNFNMSVVYTNHIYFSDYGWTDDNDFYYDVNRADTLMLGAEVRF